MNIDWKKMITADAAKSAALARARTDAIAELAATEKAAEDAARLDRAAVLIGDPKTMEALENKLRDAQEARSK